MTFYDSGPKITPLRFLDTFPFLEFNGSNARIVSRFCATSYNVMEASIEVVQVPVQTTDNLGPEPIEM